jgi:hypothetical protein
MSSIGYTWRINGWEMAGGTKPDTCSSDGVANTADDVSAAVTAAIRRTYGEERPEVLARVLTDYWGPLRHSLLTDGVTATQKAGGSWESSAGPITVKLWCL